jgi:uroporphyrinogen-III synthase
MGADVRLMPLFAVVPVPWEAPDPAGFDGLVLTSANAVRHGGEELQKLKSLPVHAVGAATADLARAAGFTVTSVGDGGAERMQMPAGQRLLHLAGRDHRAVAAARTIIVYEVRALDEPPGLPAIADAVFAVHSPRAGARLAELAGDRSRFAIAAISPAAAEACGPGWQCVRAATEPTDEALLALAGRLCESCDG